MDLNLINSTFTEKEAVPSFKYFLTLSIIRDVNLLHSTFTVSLAKSQIGMFGSNSSQHTLKILAPQAANEATYLDNITPIYMT